MTSYHCTEETYKALLEQEAQLKKELAETLARLGDAAESDTNTWHDNAAFDATNEQIRHLQSQLSAVAQSIQNAIVVEPAHGDKIGIGHVVTIRLQSGALTEIKIVGQRVPGVDDDLQQVSANSPLGSALLGHSPGDIVAYSAPRGTTTVEVVSVR